MKKLSIAKEGGEDRPSKGGSKRLTAKSSSVSLKSKAGDVTMSFDLKPEPVEEAHNLNEFILLKHMAEEFLMSLPASKRVEEYAPRRSSLGAALRVTMDGVIYGINNGLLILYEQATEALKKHEGLQCLKESEVVITPFIKVELSHSPEFVLYQQRSKTVPAGTPEAIKVDRENKAYDYVTKGKGRLKRKNDHEAQTRLVLYKSRPANTDVIVRHEAGSYVSTSEMFDTYRKLQMVRSSIELDDETVVPLLSILMPGYDPCDAIGRSKSFNLSQLVTQRTLAGNTFREQQRRFRNMVKPDPLAMDVDYLYSTKVLWHLYVQNADETDRRAVSCMSFCPSNGDILAVGYGAYTLGPLFVPKSGYILIWSMKNPVWPEKKIHYDVSVVVVEFSPFRPQLLAIGLYDGSVEVRDITTDDNSLVAISQRESSPGYEPVLDIKWIGNDPGEDADIEPFLTVSQDGSVMKYRCINSPYLLGYVHAVLDRVEGSPEGLHVRRKWNTLEVVRNPQLLGITLDPKKQDIFHVISNEGVIYKCSTNYPHQHLSLWQTHEGATFNMQYSPWSPKLFLTCGDDCCIRIWIEGIFKPLVTLTNRLLPIHCAYWSKTHSTVIVSLNRGTFDVWDIRRSTLKPMSSTKLEESYMTTAKVSNCGRSIAIGNERGMVYLCALDEMPFSPVCQYEELKAAIFKALLPFPELVKELVAVGYFGYPKSKYSII